ncbi:CD209 antigen-like protein E isoform X2 [Macrobrachium nipponense]|uniref:CD209 antigen-like protein E isoform X2 n=1 Tax=Macrobrachium nipponense TaxID=159736 RepID=UPI0030C88E73
MKIEGTRTFPVGWKARELWAQLTQMAVSAILLLLLFVPLGSWAREHLQFAPGKTLPGDLVDYWVTDASSQCVCRIMCIRNISCSGVTVQYNGAQLTCEFSHDEVLVENLVERSDANTWIFNACPLGYDIFNGSCYYFRSSYKDWADAQNDCKFYGSELVKITSQGENDFIKGKVSNNGFWIGLNDKAKEKDFKWSVDNSAVEDNGNYSSWADSQPDNDSGQDCVVVNSHGKWHDDDCAANHCYVCEIPAS